MPSKDPGFRRQIWDILSNMMYMIAGDGWWLLQLCSVVCSVLGALFVIKWKLKILRNLFMVSWATLASYLWKRNLVAEYGGRWAVVTGSTDGIGKEYARQLAQMGMNIVLISRTLERLKKVEQEIRKEFGVDTHIIRADFLHGREIYEGIAEELKNKDIGILVNNVAYFGKKPQNFIKATEEDIWRYVNVNVASVVAMTKLVLPQMLARKCGAIINISSFFALFPVPKSATYAATKAFVSSFSQALEFECHGSGITVQTVEPSFVSTSMISFSSYFRKPSVMVPSAADCVSGALSTLGYTKITSGTWNHALQAFIARRCSNNMIKYVLNKLWKFLEEDAEKTR